MMLQSLQINKKICSQISQKFKLHHKSNDQKSHVDAQQAGSVESRSAEPQQRQHQKGKEQTDRQSHRQRQRQPVEPERNGRAPRPQNGDTEGQPDAQQQVEQLAAEAGAEAGARLAAQRHRRVRNEVADGVAPGEGGEAEDGVREAEDDPEGLEQAHQLVGDHVDPDDGDAETEEAE
jgi:hypothetical protein